MATLAQPSNDMPSGGFDPKPFRTAANAAANRLRISDLPLMPLPMKRMIATITTIVVMMIVVILTSVAGQKVATLATLPLLVVTVIGLSLTDTASGLLFFLCYVALEGLYKYTSEFSPAVYVVCPILGFLIAVCWFLSPTRRASSAGTDNTQPPFAPAVYAFALLVLMQLLNPNSTGVVSGIAGAFVWYISPLSVFVVAYGCTRRSRQVINLFYVIAALAMVVSTYALIQFKLGGAWCASHLAGYTSANNRGWYIVNENGSIDSGAFRPISTAALAGGYTTLSVYGVIACAAIALMPDTKLVPRILCGVCIFTMSAALMLAAVRSSVVLLLIALPVMILLNAKSVREIVKSYIGAVAAVLILLTVVAVVNFMTGNKIAKRYRTVIEHPTTEFVTERGNNFVTFALLIEEDPLGVGFQRGVVDEAATAAPTDKHALFKNRESQWNALQADTGFAGVLLILWILVGLIVFALKTHKHVPDPRLRVAMLGCNSIILALFIGSLFGPILLSNYFFWIIAGVMVAIPRIAKSELPARIAMVDAPEDNSERLSRLAREKRQELRSTVDTMGAEFVTSSARAGMAAESDREESVGSTDAERDTK